MIIKKRQIMIVSVLLASILTVFFCFLALSEKKTAAGVNKVKIVLDAGHGGIDDGAIGSTTGAKESVINLLIVNFLKEYLEDAGFSVFLTRNSEAGLYGIASSSLKRKDMEK